MTGAAPAADAAQLIVRAIVSVVPASRWVFASFGRDGTLGRLLASDIRPDQLAALTRELERQRAKVPTGSRLAATLSPLGEFESGATLVFADTHRTFGVLMLLRSSELGPFTSAEVSVLAFALGSASEQFAALRLLAVEAALPETFSPSPPPAEVPAGVFYVLDRQLKIVLGWGSEDQRRIALTGLRTRVADRLPAAIEATVRELTAAWMEPAAEPEPGTARPVPFLVVRTEPLTGPDGLFIGVRIDRLRAPNSLAGAATRFRISPRELQVLALVLDGTHLEEIGRRMHITTSTVQDHIHSMVEKTASRNRSELIARVLGWERSAPPAAS
jgi:DNA-binding CsgD family transcriptional regulator